MRFLTAVFGEPYLRAGLALEATFHRFNSHNPLLVFTDQPGNFRKELVSNMEGLVAEYPEFYKAPGTGRRNVFKYSLMALVQEMYPGETVCWIDSDLLIFGDLTEHLVDGSVNVIAHGRRPEDVMNMGGGLKVDATKYAISGLFALPPGPDIDILREVTLERPTWDDDGFPNHKIGDQLILNHLIARTETPVNWVTDDRRYIYNLKVADGFHPIVGDTGLARIRWRRRPSLDSRRIVAFYWVKNKLDSHIADDFSTFAPRARRALRALYGLR